MMVHETTYDDTGSRDTDNNGYVCISNTAITNRALFDKAVKQSEVRSIWKDHPDSRLANHIFSSEFGSIWSPADQDCSAFWNAWRELKTL